MKKKWGQKINHQKIQKMGEKKVSKKWKKSGGNKKKNHQKSWKKSGGTKESSKN